MSFLYFFTYAAVVTAITYCLLYMFIIKPARKKACIQRAITELIEGIKELNSNALLNGSIRSGDHLHDKFFESIFRVYTEESYKNSRFSSRPFDRKEKDNWKKFVKEVNELPEDVQETISNCTLAIGQLVYLYNPLRTRLFLFKLSYRKRQRRKHRENLIKSGQTILARESWSQNCHAS